MTQPFFTTDDFENGSSEPGFTTTTQAALEANAKVAPLLGEVAFLKAFLMRCNKWVVPGEVDSEDAGVKWLQSLVQENERLKADNRKFLFEDLTKLQARTATLEAALRGIQTCSGELCINTNCSCDGMKARAALEGKGE